MVTVRFFILLVYCVILFPQRCQAETVYIHTDNLIDLKAFESKNGANNLSVATNLLALNFAGINIQYKYMTLKRSLQFMAQERNICVVNKIKTKERKTKYLFSQPINLFLGRRLYQLTFYEPLADNHSVDHKVQLNEVFKQKPNAKVLIAAQISYGDILDEQLTDLPAKNKVVRHSSGHDDGIINMFTQNRAEFSLLYPQRVYKFRSKLKVRSYGIASISPFVLGHLMCTKSPTTKAFLKEVNNNLNSADKALSLLNIHLDLINASDKEIFEYYFRQAFLMQ